MMTAQALYHSLGFQIIHPYYDLPPDILTRAVFMELAWRSSLAPSSLMDIVQSKKEYK